MKRELKIDQEFLNLIPPLTEVEYEQLTENILTHGCRDPIITWRGAIIDGHNRYGICQCHNIPFETAAASFSCRYDAVVWIIENQLGRRNLTDAMRIELASCKADMLRKKAKENLSHTGGDKKNGNGNGPVEETVNVRKSIAREAGVSEWKVHKYIKIKESGDAKLLEQVKRGEVKIGAAAQKAKEMVVTTITEIPVDKELFKRGAPLYVGMVVEQMGVIEKYCADFMGITDGGDNVGCADTVRDMRNHLSKQIRIIAGLVERFGEV
jgi:hypothetical protein